MPDLGTLWEFPEAIPSFDTQFMEDGPVTGPLGGDALASRTGGHESDLHGRSTGRMWDPSLSVGDEMMVLYPFDDKVSSEFHSGSAFKPMLHLDKDTDDTIAMTNGGECCYLMRTDTLRG